LDEDRAHDPALRRAAMGGAIAPVLQVSRLEEFVDQPDEPFVVDLLAEGRQQDRVVDVVEEPLDISLDEPFGPDPGLTDLGQGRVAASARAEAVRARRELRLEVRFQEGTYPFLQ